MKDLFQADFGARLKAGREARNLKTSDVAAKLKLTARQIEAIEQEEFDHLPSEIFVRGFVKNYARLVGLDPDSLIAPVDAQAAVSETITAPNAGLNVGSNGLRLWLVYPLIGLIAFVILVAGMYYWLRQGEDTLLTAPPEAQSANEPAQTGESLHPPALVTPPEALGPSTENAVDSEAIGTLNSGAPMAQAPQPGEPAAPADVMPSPMIAASPPAAAAKPVEPPIAAAMPMPEAERPSADTSVKTGLRSMRFQPSQDAWIQVVDGKGSHFSKLVRAGSSESFSGVPPFRLVVGEAALVKLTYNGHSIDLKPFIGQKVARLTLE